MIKSKYLPHPHKLAVFAAVAEHKNVTLAAQNLNMTQPAVSNIIHQLERHFEVKLVELNGKKPQITEAGKELVRHWHHISHAYQNLDENLRAQAAGYNGTINLAMLPSIKYLIPKIITLHKKIFQQVEFECHLTSPQEITEGIIEHRYDLGLLVRVPSHPLIEKIDLGMTSFLFIASPNHPLSQLETVDIKQLKEYPFVVDSHSMAPTETLYRFFADHHLEPKIAFRIDTTDAVKEAVIQEMGLALIPKIACTRELTNKLITALPIQSNLLNHNCHLISRRERPHNKMTAAFKQSVIDFFAQGNI